MFILCGAIVLAALMQSCTARMSVVAVEVGSDVVISYSGSLDISGLSIITPNGNDFVLLAAIAPQFSLVSGSGVSDCFAAISGPTNFGTQTTPNLAILASSFAGDAFAVQNAIADVLPAGPIVCVPDGYAGEVITGTSTYLSHSFASTGLRKGKYKYRLTSAPNNDVDIFIGLNGGASADPHFIGAGGQEFNVSGVADASYVVFAHPHFQVNMHLAADGPEDRFITKINVLVGDQVLHFDTFHHNASHFQEMNAGAAPFGASVVHRADITTIELCSEHTIVISKHVADIKIRPWLQHVNGKAFVYLNVNVKAPGCDNVSGGLLGQTYQCKYVSKEAKFVYDANSEEQFRVKQLSIPVFTKD